MDKLIHLILLSGLVCIPGSLAENLAFIGTAAQSSTYDTWLAQRAIDGVRYGPDPFSGPFCSSTQFQSNPWWRLDLLDEYKIKTVIITARPDCCLHQTSGAEIRIGNSLENNGNNNPICAVMPDPLPDRTVRYSCYGMVGRYVNVILAGQEENMNLCEVEIYETENLAFGGTATQSSTYPDWLAQRAIDGVRHGPDPDVSPFCSGTTYQSHSWWSLDLLDYYSISTVIITAHDKYLKEASGAEIRIGNSLENDGNNNPICAVTPDPLPGNTVSFSCPGMEGRYVNVVMSGHSEKLNLCEVEVYGKLKRTKTFLRLKFSSSGDVAAESDEILHQLESVLGSHISDFKLSWTQLPKKEEEQEEDRDSCAKHL